MWRSAESAERLDGGSDLRGGSTHHVPGPVVALVLSVQPDSVGEGRRLNAAVLRQTCRGREGKQQLLGDCGLSVRGVVAVTLVAAVLVQLFRSELQVVSALCVGLATGWRRR